MSSRLKGELVHPNNTGWFLELRFSPDGRRIVASDMPSGVIAVWDVASGKRLTAIDTGYRRLVISPDGRTLYAPHTKREHERVERDGKPMTRWIFDGEVRAWSLDDGKLSRAYKHQPPRGEETLQLSPDGTKLITGDNLSGVYERGYKGAASIWDVKTGDSRTLNGRQRPGPFSPDGRWCSSILLQEEGNYALARKLIDASSGLEKWSLPVVDKNALVEVQAFSRDGRILFGTVLVYDHGYQWDKWRSWMKWWDAATGREIASFDGEPNGGFTAFRCSPDGQMLAVVDWCPDKSKLFLYSIPEKRLLRTVFLGEKTDGLECSPWDLAFHPDGRWLAVVTNQYPETGVSRDLDPRDLPQPRILLIATATGEIRETMIAPQALANAVRFSPDGRTLATAGHGRVLLWDTSKMPE